MRIAIYGSRRQAESAKTVADFLDRLGKKSVHIVMHRKLYRHLCDIIPDALVNVESIVDGPDFEADLAVSLGGDGTFLRTAMWVGPKEIPIIGVNTGHLGYLTSITADELPYLLDYLADDRFRIERRGLIELISPVPEAHFCPYALNEVAISKDDSASMIWAEVEVDGVRLGEYRADGLLVCTSTGSTAYNLSAGGPIVQPTVNVHVISPVAAHSLSMRPLVVDGNARIKIRPRSRTPRVRLALDGRSSEIETGTEIQLAKAPFSVLLLQPSDFTFADSLREKLHWGGE